MININHHLRKIIIARIVEYLLLLYQNNFSVILIFRR